MGIKRGSSEIYFVFSLLYGFLFILTITTLNYKLLNSSKKGLSPTTLAPL